MSDAASASASASGSAMSASAPAPKSLKDPERQSGRQRGEEPESIGLVHSSLKKKTKKPARNIKDPNRIAPSRMRKMSIYATEKSISSSGRNAAQESFNSFIAEIARAAETVCKTHGRSTIGLRDLNYALQSLHGYETYEDEDEN